MPRCFLALLTLLPLTLLLLAGCDAAGFRSPSGPGAYDPATTSELPVEPGDEPEETTGRQGRGPGGGMMAASLLGTPRDTISHQYVLLRHGKVDELRRLFTESVRDEITPELVEQLGQNLPPVSLNELVHEVQEEEVDGQLRATVKRKDGSVLTTLVKQGNQWQAETLWFLPSNPQ
ncbi:MAG: hypothetical protein J5I93_20615 [Pirellulaceae bacterium]|nr:hypothetical protein [Pirellulaceae bacterium]